MLRQETSVRMLRHTHLFKIDHSLIPTFSGLSNQLALFWLAYHSVYSGRDKVNLISKNK